MSYTPQPCGSWLNYSRLLLLGFLLLSSKQVFNHQFLNKLRCLRVTGWMGAKLFQTCRPPPEGKRSTSWVKGEDIAGRRRYVPAVKSGTLKGWGLMRPGRGVPMVITMGRPQSSDVCSRGPVDLDEKAEPWEITERQGFDELSNVINFTSN